MSKARQFLVVITLFCTAVFCLFAGSAFANWFILVDQPPVVSETPMRGGLDAPIPIDQRERPGEGARLPGREPLMDLYGNEVTDAVAGYLLDSRGSVYEEHSPQTEVPRLAAPRS